MRVFWKFLEGFILFLILLLGTKVVTMFLPHPPAPVTVLWHNQLTKSRPPGFRVMAFPKDNTVPIRDAANQVIGSLDRAMANEMEELDQPTITLQLVSGSAQVSRSDLVYLPSDADFTRCIETWRSALAQRAANLKTSETWVTLTREGNGATVTIQVADSDETRRWRYQTDGINIHPLEFAYKNRMDEFLEGERLSDKAAVIALGPAAMISLCWTRFQLRRDAAKNRAKDTGGDRHC